MVARGSLTMREEKYTLLFNARTASLCSQIWESAVNSTQRIGTACLAASWIHLLRTSTSALVLSEETVLLENAWNKRAWEKKTSLD